MDRIGIVGVSWRDVPPEGLGRFSVPREQRGPWLRELADQLELDEAFALWTCNRVELGFVVPPAQSVSSMRGAVFSAMVGREAGPGEAERSLRAWAGEGAVEHCFLVAAGMDSARLGERDVARQVREARDLSQELGLLGDRLSELLDGALRVAAGVHRDTGLGCGRTSLAQIASEHARARLLRTPGRVALVGISPMTEQVAADLRSGGVDYCWVNRDLQRALAAAAERGGTARSLEEFRLEPDAVEVVVCATGAPEPVLGHAALERLAARAPSGQAPLIVDLAVPADVDPGVAAGAGVPRIGMNDVADEARRSEDQRRLEAAEARVLVDESLDRFARRMTDRRVGPVLAGVQRRYREVALEGVERLLRRSLPELPEEQREAVRRWAETLARRFAHLPTAGIKRLADRYGLEGVGEFLAASPDLLDAQQVDPLPTAEESTTR